MDYVIFLAEAQRNATYEYPNSSFLNATHYVSPSIYQHHPSLVLVLDSIAISGLDDIQIHTLLGIGWLPARIGEK